jgi:GAF domain
MVDLMCGTSSRGSQPAETEAFLAMLDMAGSVPEPKALAQKLVLLVRDLSGCEATAVRLRVGLDFPYAAFLGFPERFIAMEDALCSTDREGKVIRDDQRRPILACQCGKVLSGKADPFQAHFTAQGSLIIASHHELKCQDRTRRCQLVGYETMGLFPIRKDGVTYGLIQCNDTKPGVITAEAVILLEDLANAAAHLLRTIMA